MGSLEKTLRSVLLLPIQSRALVSLCRRRHAAAAAAAVEARLFFLVSAKARAIPSYCSRMGRERVFEQELFSAQRQRRSAGAPRCQPVVPPQGSLHTLHKSFTFSFGCAIKMPSTRTLGAPSGAAGDAASPAGTGDARGGGVEGWKTSARPLRPSAAAESPCGGFERGSRCMCGRKDPVADG